MNTKKNNNNNTSRVCIAQHALKNQTNNDNNKLYFTSFIQFTCEIIKFVLCCCCYGYYWCCCRCCWNDDILSDMMCIWRSLSLYLFFHSYSNHSLAYSSSCSLSLCNRHTHAFEKIYIIHIIIKWVTCCLQYARASVRMCI